MRSLIPTSVPGPWQSVVASSVGGIPEVVNEETGVLVKSIDAHSIEEAMIEALEKSWSTKTIRAYAERFSWDENIEQLIRMLTK